MVMLIPTMYVVAISSFGLKDAVTALGKALGVPYRTFGAWFIDVSWPIAFEYLIFTASFTLSLLVLYGACNLRRFLISAFFLWSTTAFFLLNTFAPYGTVGVLQAFVPFTTKIVAQVLEVGGWQTSVRAIENGLGPGMVLSIMSESTSYSAVVYWPSAGIQSLIIYTGVMLLFIKDLHYSTVRKVSYFLLGVLGTFVVNVCRIASIMVIGLKIGRLEASMFHDYYGELFFIAWMISYLVILVYGSNIINRAKRYLNPR
jgi:thaumarchaeosortase